MTMKKGLLSLVMILSAGFLFAQTIDLGTPKSWNAKVPAVTRAVEMPSFDLQALRAEDAFNDEHKIGPWRFGYNHAVDLGLDNSGEWFEYSNGDRIWQLSVHSQDALSLNLIFSEFNLPEGATVYLYSADRTMYIGAYTSENNNEEGILGTELLPVDEMVIEYNEPAQVRGQGTLTIGTVTHGYRSIINYASDMAKALNSSGDCNIDVGCPLGIGWEEQIRSVAMIVVGGNGACTGALVNNTAQDGTPYFLTANHCLGGSVASWVFRFNWDSPTTSCATTANSSDPGPPYDSVNGSVLRASNGGSDVALLELNSVPPTGYQVFYAGWDRSESAVTEGTGIHHPSGDVKKICRENNNLSQANWNGAACWEVADWDEGVTEPGSSGSPLFDQNGRVIGQLFGGGAACSGTNDNGAPDYYGRFGISWDNGSNASQRLEDWLDPTGNNPLVLDGYDPNAATLPDNAGITSITEPTGTKCTDVITPEVTLRNYGTNTLMSVDILYDVDGTGQQTYNWSGNLSAGASVTVTLPSQTVSGGAHTFNAATSSPNGGLDTDPSNDAASSSFTTVPGGEAVFLDLFTDCYGEEITWEVQNSVGTVLYSGGPYTNGSNGVQINEEFCLGANECYAFIIEDSYGDGMNSTQWGCNDLGDYSITDLLGNVLAEMIAQNSDYGDSETNNFCVSPTSIVETELSFDVYPNPTTGELFIKTSEEIEFVEIMDSHGRLIDQMQVNSSDFQVDLNVAKGVYFLRMTGMNSQSVERIVVR